MRGDDEGRARPDGETRGLPAAGRPAAELDALREQFCLQIDRLPLAYVLFDAQNRVLDWNAAAEKTFGFRREEVLGRDLVELIVELPVGEWLQGILRRLRAGDMEAHSVNENRTKDGRVIVCEWFNTPLVGPDGTYLGAVSLAQDITERRRAEKLLDENRRRFRAVFENALDPILLMDDAGRYVDGNPAACELLGYSRDELVRLTVWDVTPVEARQHIPEVMRHFLSAGTLSGEYTMLARGGATRVVEFRSVANILPGLHLAVHRDVTERKRAERGLREYSERVRALSRRLLTVQEEERRRIARELHDEVGQLLTGLAFAVDAAVSGPREAAGARLAEARSTIDEILGRVRELSFDLRPALLDHLGLVPALRALIDRFTASTGVRVNFTHAGVSARLAPEVETAAFRVAQEALTNVARHAGVGAAEVRVWADGSSLTVQVEDAGAGFDPEAALAAGRSSGLAGMQERVTLLAGRFLIESVPGGGTHVLAEFPLAGRAGEGR